MPPMAKLKEFRVDADEAGTVQAGSEVSLDIFQAGDFVDVTGRFYRKRLRRRYQETQVPRRAREATARTNFSDTVGR